MARGGDLGAKFAVVFDIGSAGPAEIAAGLNSLGSVTFAVNVNPATEPLLPLIRELGDVILLGPSEELTVKLLRMRAPDAILTFSDPMIALTARLAAGLGLAYHSPATAQALTSKWEQREALRRAGVDHVRSRRLTSPGQWPAAAAAVGLPAVVKPVVSAGSRNTFKIEDAASGARLISELLHPAHPREGELIVEEYLTGRDCQPIGDYVSVESAICKGAVTHLAVTGKLPLVPPFREIGHFWPAVLAPGERATVERLAEAALHALGVTVGITHTEIKLTRSGPRIIEVNGRIGGLVNHLGRHALDIDLIELAGRLALGENPPQYALPPGGVTFLHHNPVPPVACTLVAAQGARQVRDMLGVRSYRPVIRPGTEIAASVQTRWLDLLIGHSADHASMLATIDAELDLLSFSFMFATGRAQMSARSLRETTLESWFG